jgi:O-antigen/teichoic acid export membrane protein
VSPVKERVRDHLGSPLTRSGYALLLSSVITSLLGLGYWVLAAHFYDERVLGRGAALVSAMVLVTSLATAGLKRGLIRFVPTAGRRGRSLVTRVYAFGLGISLLFGIALLTLFDGFEDQLTALQHSRLAPAVFLVGILIWGLFVLQDSVLIGARRATMVPTTNAIFSALKIGLLLLFSVLISREWGVFLSWIVPGAVVAVGVNLWLFRTGLDPREQVREEEVSLGQVVRFTSAEYVAALLWQTAIYFTPLLILARLGAAANAHYYLPAQIAYALYLVSSNVTDALVAEGSTAPKDLATRVRRNGAQVALLMVPGVTGLVLGAPLIMHVFGSGYAGDSITTLQLLALSAAPNAVSTMVIAVAHVRQRMWLVVVLQTVMAGLTLGVGFLLMDSHGVVGVAMGWLVAQCVTAVLAVAFTLRLEPGLTRTLRVIAVARATSLRKAIARRRAMRLVRSRLVDVPQGALPDGPVGLLGFQHDVLVVSAGTASIPLVVRIAIGRQGRRGIAAHRDQLRSLREDPQLEPLVDLIPEVLVADHATSWLVETALPGESASQLDRKAKDRAMRAGLAALGELHAATARQLIVGEKLVDRWVHEPIAAIAEVVQSPRAAAGLQSLHRRLTSELLGRPLTIARLHGDPSFDNLLFSPDGAEVTGMVDWESSGPGVPELDLVGLVLARRAHLGTEEMGTEVLDLLANGWSADERELLGSSWSVNAHVRPTTFVLLAWLGHVGANLAKTERYGHNGWWVRHNVVQVLEALDHDGAGSVALAPDPLAPDVVATSTFDTEPAAAEVAAARFRPTRARHGQAIATCAAWIAYAASAPGPLRIALVLAGGLVLPAMAIGRLAGARTRLARAVLGTTGAVALDVALAEVLLYAHLWSPGLFLVLTGIPVLVAWAAPRAVEVSEHEHDREQEQTHEAVAP